AIAEACGWRGSPWPVSVASPAVLSEYSPGPNPLWPQPERCADTGRKPRPEYVPGPGVWLLVSQEAEPARARSRKQVRPPERRLYGFPERKLGPPVRLQAAVRPQAGGTRK